MFGKKKQQKPTGYTYKPREFDREERIALQKIVSNIPVTRKMLTQDMLVNALTNYVAKNIKTGSMAAKNVNTTKDPYLFFKSYKELVESTEELIKIEPYWRFEGMGPTEQLADINEKKDRLIKGFLCDAFGDLVAKINAKHTASGKQKLFDDFQNALLVNADIMGEENFAYFKELCAEKLSITDETPQKETAPESAVETAQNIEETAGESENNT